MSSQDYVTRYRLYKLGGFAHNFESIIKNIGKGTPLTKITSMTYFMSYAKRIFERMNLPKEVEKISYLSKTWDYWMQQTREIERRKLTYDFYPFLAIMERTIVSSFERISLEEDDLLVRNISLSNVNLYHEYVSNLLKLRQKEVLYDVLSSIWLTIYANKMLSLNEIQQIVERLKLPEEQLPPEELNPEVDDEIDESKADLKKNEIESTPLGFKKALKTVMPLLEVFRDNFYKDIDIKSKLNNAEIYTFSLLVTAAKIMKTDEQTNQLTKNAFLISKRIYTYNLIKTLSKTKSDNFIIKRLLSKYESLLSSMVLELFEQAETLLATVERDTSGKARGGDDEEEGKRKILNYVMKQSKIDKKHLFGMCITHDDITTIVEMLKGGEKIVNVDVDIEPFHLKFSDLAPINLVIGMTGAGKTVAAIKLIENGVNEGYCIFDSSLNRERASEMLFCSIPLEEKFYGKRAFKKLTVTQDMQPKKLPMTILFPYYGPDNLPKLLPAGSKIVTIPLYKLANRLHALSLLFTSMPNNEVLNMVNFILMSKADETWDLDVLRYELRKLLEEKEPSVEVLEKVGNLEVVRTTTLSKKYLKQALALLLSKSDLISSGKARTAMNFDELCQPGVFVTPYLGHIPSKTDCFAFITWFFNEIIDYAASSKNKEKKIGILINEAQTIIPSQSLIGGPLGSEKYSMSVEFATNSLQWRGLNLRVLVLTQQQGQLREQLRYQAGLKIIFHTNNDADLKYAFDLIQNQQLKENLKMLVVNRFFKDEHLCCIVSGPENENVKLLGVAIPACGFELPSTDIFKLYEKNYGTDMIESSMYVDLIGQEKADVFEEHIKDDKDIRILRKTVVVKEGEEIGDSDDVKVNRETLNAVFEKVASSNVIPDGSKIMSKIELSKMHEIKKDEQIIKNEKLEKIESSHLVDSEKQAVMPTPEYFELAALREKAKDAGYYYDDLCKDVSDKDKVLRTAYYALMHIFIGCKPFAFGISKSPKTKDKPPYVLIGDDVFKHLGINVSFVHYYRLWNKLKAKSLFIQSSIKEETQGKHRYCLINDEFLQRYIGSLDKDLLEKVYLTCAREYYNTTKMLLPWREEVLKKVV